MKHNFFIRSLLREAKRVGQDHTLILSLLFAPIFYAFFYGSIYLNKTEEEVPIAVVDHDHSALSRQYIRMIDESQKVTVSIKSSSLQDAQNDFLESKVQGILVIEKGFESNLKALRSTDVGLILNTSRFLPSNDINETVSEISLMIGAGVRLANYEMHGDNEDLSFTEAMPISLNDRTVFAAPLSYGSFLLPGLLLLILQQTFLIGLAESTAREREQKTVIDWFALSDGKVWPALIGKGAFYIILFSAYALFFHVINYYVLNIHIAGNPFLLAFTILTFYVVLVFFGQFFGSLFSKEIWALQFFAFSSYPIFLLAGYSWPLYAMNDTLQFIAGLLPTTPMLNMYVGIVFKDASFAQIAASFFQLCALGVFYGVLAYWRWNRLQKRLRP